MGFRSLHSDIAKYCETLQILTENSEIEGISYLAGGENKRMTKKRGFQKSLFLEKFSRAKTIGIKSKLYDD
jgi:hypothetical protein